MHILEREIQKAFVEFVKLKYPREYRALIKIDNEGVRSPAGHHYAKLMGLHKGASDIFIAVSRGGYHGLWIEIKPDHYKVTNSNRAHHLEQMAFLEQMIENGYCGAMCIGLDACISFTEEYFKMSPNVTRLSMAAFLPM